MQDWWFHKLLTKRHHLFWAAHQRSVIFDEKCKELLIKMLEPNPDDRWNIDDIEKNEWYKNEILYVHDQIGREFLFV